MMMIGNDVHAQLRRLRDRTERQLQDFLEILEHDRRLRVMLRSPEPLVPRPDLPAPGTSVTIGLFKTGQRLMHRESSAEQSVRLTPMRPVANMLLRREAPTNATSTST